MKTKKTVKDPFFEKHMFSFVDQFAKCSKVESMDYNGRVHFKDNGCFICPHCYTPFWPTLEGWTPEVRDLPKKRKKGATHASRNHLVPRERASAAETPAAQR
jgi:hypothetical protein